MSAYAIEFDKVYKEYPDESGRGMRTILNGIGLRVRFGEFVTMVGSSGCGKSTLLRLILGSEKPTRGEVRIGGQVLNAVNRDRGIVFQKYTLFPHRTVLENIAFGLDLENMNLFQRVVLAKLYRRQLRQYRDQALEYLECIGLKPSDANKYPEELSGGMQQRVAIAQAMIMKPKVLLMDEPFGALDDATREKMQLFTLEQWEKAQMTIFFVTHNLEEAVFLGTRVLVLSQHYTSDDGPGEGSKIVIDRASPKSRCNSTEQKYSPEFSELLRQIRTQGLNPDRKTRVSDFDLSHPDALLLKEAV